FLADILLHYVMPLLYLFHWVAFAPKGRQRFRNSLWWLVYPLAYLVYALARGAATDTYPYPFIDVIQLGNGIVARNSILLALAYWVLGLLLLAADGWLAAAGPAQCRKEQPKKLV
ncbi:MAG TPA: Pr6Pr family membrane protein, partial [Anseongella sp.]|nr:Pr6Pr family membrane protein [Anseongella sp.]